MGARSTDAANVAQQASDPRTSDATASGPTVMLPTAGMTATVAAPSAAGASPKSPSAASSSPAPAGSHGANTETAPREPTRSRNVEPPTKIGARHVLVQWMGSERAASSIVRSREQALSVAREVLRRARNKEDFARLAIEYSDEPGAGGRGGSLGRFGRGQMVGDFDAAAFKLEVGQISDIVETPFGFHIIQRTE